MSDEAVKAEEGQYRTQVWLVELTMRGDGRREGPADVTPRCQMPIHYTWFTCLSNFLKGFITLFLWGLAFLDTF